jgi:hypothetical protein
MVFAENKLFFLYSLKGFRMLPKWISGEHTVATVSVSETDVVDNKCSLRTKIYQGHLGKFKVIQSILKNPISTFILKIRYHLNVSIEI